MNMTDQDKQKIKEVVSKLRKGLRVTKIVCTRSVKGKAGDHYIGLSAAFAAAWNTTQDDAGGAADLNSAQDGDEHLAQNGLPLDEARIAAHLLALEADLLAHDHAMAGSNISPEQRDQAQKAIRHNFSRLVAAACLREGNGNGGSGPGTTE